MNPGETHLIEMEVLSPVHISSGRGYLLNDVDFVCGKGIHIIDIDRVLAEIPVQSWTGTTSPWRLSQLLKPNQYGDYARYTLDERTRHEKIKRILECVKDVRNKPYIPGSSLKGAIRTAIASAMLSRGEIQVESRDLGYSPKFADDPIMIRLFGTNPNHDLLRTLHVVDSESVSAEAAIELTTVALYSLRQQDNTTLLKPKSPTYRFTVEVEALRPGLRIAGCVRQDRFLLHPDQARRLGFDKRVRYVKSFLHHCNTFSRALIHAESSFFGRHGLPEIKRFYDHLAQVTAALNKECECLLQISWGTGWTSKTVGTVLSQDFLADMSYQFRLARKGQAIFPKTRRVVERGGTPKTVTGWIKLKLCDCQ